MGQWSSFSEQKSHFDMWRSFLGENKEETSAYNTYNIYTDRGGNESLASVLYDLKIPRDYRRIVIFDIRDQVEALKQYITEEEAPIITLQTSDLAEKLATAGAGKEMINKILSAVGGWTKTQPNLAIGGTTSTTKTSRRRAPPGPPPVPLSIPRGEPEVATATPIKTQAVPGHDPSDFTRPIPSVVKRASKEKKPSREEKAAAKKDRISTIKAAKTLDALKKLVPPPDKDHDLWVLKARDERRGEIKRADREEKKEIAAVLNIKKNAPDDVRAPEAGSEDKFQSAAKAASREVVPTPETEKDVKDSSRPIEDVPPAEKKKIRASVKTGKKRVAATIDYKTKEAAAAAVLKVYQDTAQTSVGGVQKYDIPTQEEVERTVVNVIKAIRDKRNPRAPREIIKTEFGALGKTIPPVEQIQDVIEKSINISIDDDKELDKMELDIANWAERAAALGLSEKKELKVTKAVQDYINESHEDKFNKLLKAFIK
tara:strand:+ start:1048 stop:2502 length:1455 start_codon:yes stop_codon:yes gene_type:complete